MVSSKQFRHADEWIPVLFYGLQLIIIIIFLDIQTISDLAYRSTFSLAPALF